MWRLGGGSSALGGDALTGHLDKSTPKRLTSIFYMYNIGRTFGATKRAKDRLWGRAN